VAEKLSWDNPICERCWIEAEGIWIADALSAREALSSVRLPVRVKEPVIERCSWCGDPTIFGVYKRADPRALPFPAMDTAQ
jgi:hypothetical protein